MPQKSNLNISPYYDDFDPNKNFYRVLFKPGYPVQARELTTLQTSLQNQIESFGNNIFKEGSVVIPGAVNYDQFYYSVKINSQHQGIDVVNYIDSLIGKKVKGQSSGVIAIITNYSNISVENNITDLTLFVKYVESGSDNNAINSFIDGESLLVLEAFAYGNTTIGENQTVASLVSSDASSVGSSVGISSGVYFARGSFVNVSSSLIVLDAYSNTSSYRVGLNIIEDIVSSKEDSSLLDNAKGFTNYASPGADRLKISAVLSKKLLSDFDDKNFIELIRIENGEVKKIQATSQYSIVKDYFAKRTYEESGDYSLDQFRLEVLNSLNDGISNAGLFYQDQKTQAGNTPSNDLMCVRVSAGRAYVKGYDIDKPGSSLVDVEKPRTTETVSSGLIPFKMGNIFKINNCFGTPYVGINNNNNVVNLQNQRYDKTSITGAGTTIGQARVYSYTLENSPYISTATTFNLYCFDVQTYTVLTINQSLTETTCPKSSYIRGVSSGASGYVVFGGGSGTTSITLTQTSGTFIPGEQIYINETTSIPRSIVSIKTYGIQDVKSIYQSNTNFTTAGIKTSFVADTVLNKVIPNQFSVSDRLFINNTGIATCPGRSFVGIKSDAIIRYQRSGLTTETYNRVVSVSADGSTLKLIGVPSAFGVCEGGLPTTSETVPFSLGIPKTGSNESSALYAKIPSNNISSVDLSSSSLEITGQFREQSTNSSGSLSVSVSNLGISSAFFDTFDTQRYSVFYSNGEIENLTDDQFTLSSNGTVATFSGLKTSQTSNVTVNVSVRKNLIKNKIKNYVRSEKITVNKVVSGLSTSISGLSTSPYYGLRVSDKEISLNFPDVVNVVKVFESLNSADPTLDKLTFVSGLNLNTASILGEKIIGKDSRGIAQIVTRLSASEVEVCYLNSNKFSIGESVTFQESNITSNIQGISQGNYLDITNNFILDKGQKDQYYDYSKIVRKDNVSVPARTLLIIFDRYDVSSSDSGDFYTVNSYPAERFEQDIPSLSSNVRASDVLDFRPRVSPFNPTNATKSPFAFESRNFGDRTDNTGIVVTPNESSIIGYNYYLPRIDKIVLDKNGNFIVVKGTPSLNPKEPNDVDDSMLIGTIKLPAYLYKPSDATILLSDNKRYTMRDIGKLDARISTLEKVTSLSLLELDTKTLQVQDTDGYTRFKTGFFVDDFKNKSLMDVTNVDCKSDIDIFESQLITQTDYYTFKPEIGFDSSVDIETADFTDDLPLLDPNVKKTGDLVTLNYTEKGWIEQPLASRVENVNPFNIIEFNGRVELTPASDNWVRTVYVNGGSRTISGDSDYSYIETTQTSSETDKFIRSRDVGFFSGGLKPFTRYYSFFDSVSGIDIVPKLIEITMTSGIFRIGETVKGFVGPNQLISFRVCAPNHKSGTYNAPTTTYRFSPYNRTYTIPSDYSTSSPLLNVDITSLSEEAQGKYSGYIVKDMILVGETSNAQAKVSDVKLISDGIGDILGAFFFRNPLASPPPTLRFTTGVKTFKLTSSDIDGTQLPGQVLISSAQNNYTTSGVVNNYTQTTVVVRRPPPPPPPVIIQPVIQQTVVQVTQVTQVTNVTIVKPPPPPPPPPPKRCGGKDPLAQTFTVDETGAFLTSVDIYFAKKDPNERLYVEVRTVELGTPTDQLVQDFARSVLEPDQINVSNDASIKTNIKFPSPIYLQPGKEYALVLLSPNSNNYEVWIGRMGEKTINSQYLPDAESLIVSKQYVGGSLFKSQNGTIWTSSQNDDLKFKLYKANFVPSGTFYLYNPPLSVETQINDSVSSNTIKTLPRRLDVGITTTYVMSSILTAGMKVSDGNSYGYVRDAGGPIKTLGVNNVGTGYSNGSFSNVPLYNITSSGIGAIANLQFTNSQLASITSIASTGNGYSPGDLLGITTSNVIKGKDATITVSAVDGIDMLYLSNVQGESFSVGNNLVYYNNTQTVSLANTSIRTSSLPDNLYDGSVMEITHFNHGMQSDTNKVQIIDVNPDTIPTSLTAALNIGDKTISVASTQQFSTFEGITTSRGYIKINNEIIYYNSIGSGTLGIGTRGIDSSLSRVHDVNSLIYKYELNGVSLRRINTTFNMPNDASLKSLRDIDKYHLSFNRNDRASGSTQLSFVDRKTFNDEKIKISENAQYNTILPRVNAIIPTQTTNISSQIKTTSATSSGGSEISFVSVDYEPVQLNEKNVLTSTRMVCSKINEVNNMASQKSFNMALNLVTNDPNLSPVIDLQNTAMILGRSRLNRPITNYAYDGRVNLIAGDPHSAIYISKKIDLTQPATSLQVLLSAYRHSSADFRVLYRLYKADSSEVEESYVLFPGYADLNDGSADVTVRSSNNNEFLDYQFTADNLEQFIAFSIKIVMNGTNEAYPPKFKDLRVIALA